MTQHTIPYYYYYSMHVENFNTLLRICRFTATEVDRVRSFIVVLSVEMRMRKCLNVFIMLHSKVTAHMCIQLFTCNITSTSSSLTIGQRILVFHRFGFGCLVLKLQEGFLLQCNRTVALDAFFKQIVQDPVKISWIGSGCSVATEPTAEISHYYNITQVIQQSKLSGGINGSHLFP